MDIRWLNLLLIPWLTCCTPRLSQSSLESHLIEVDGRMRSYLLHIPESYDHSVPAPLILAFHGAYSQGASMSETARLEKWGEDLGYIVVYPNSWVENWNEGCNCNKPHRLGIDDIAFVDTLVQNLCKSLNVDTARVYAVGYSQGALFTLNVACKLSHRFAAVAAVAATMSLPLSQQCSPSEYMPLMLIHGTSDPVLPWEGSDDGAFSLLSAYETIQTWTELNNCTNPMVKSYVGKKVRKEVYGGCSQDSEVILYAIEKGGHEWPKGKFNASKEIIEFFEKHKQNGSEP